jgi:hypothetical protein
MDDPRLDGSGGRAPRQGEPADVPEPPALADAPGWIALPVGRAETGPSIAELVRAVRAAGGFVGGEALFDPRYEPEMRRFLIRALELEGIPVPKGGGTP